tara:strand:- start:892 stop:1284 length:393 start_codon:yes stop_codon:yes gene_type:complete
VDTSIPVSFGELVDKLTILEIKKSKIKNHDKLNKIETELILLKEKASLLERENKKNYIKLFNELTEVNTKLWDIEDNIRKFESKKEFNDEFIELARSVYFLNDERFRVKSEINKLFNSKIQEVKEYIKYS